MIIRPTIREVIDEALELLRVTGWRGHRGHNARAEVQCTNVRHPLIGTGSGNSSRHYPLLPPFCQVGMKLALVEVEQTQSAAVSAPLFCSTSRVCCALATASAS